MDTGHGRRGTGHGARGTGHGKSVAPARASEVINHLTKDIKAPSLSRAPLSMRIVRFGPGIALDSHQSGGG